MDYQVFLKKMLDWLFSSGLHIVLVIILTWIAVKIIKKLSGRLIQLVAQQKDDGEFQKRMQTLGAMVRYVLLFAVIAVAVMIILKELGIDEREI